MTIIVQYHGERYRFAAGGELRILQDIFHRKAHRLGGRDKIRILACGIRDISKDIAFVAAIFHQTLLNLKALCLDISQAVFIVGRDGSQDVTAGEKLSRIGKALPGQPALKTVTPVIRIHNDRIKSRCMKELFPVPRKIPAQVFRSIVGKNDGAVSGEPLSVVNTKNSIGGDEIIPVV